MGGTIGVTSTPGKGSLFRVDLPVEIAEQAGTAVQFSGTPPEETLALAPGQPDLRILIAEDQRDNQLLLMKLMADIGLDARLAANGEECIALFGEWRPHLIWMDRRMPVMDGLEAARQIRQLPGGREVKIVAVTASAFEEQRQELLDAGMNDFVRKPYRIAEIYDCLAKQLGVQFIRRTAMPDGAATDRLTSEMLAALPVELRVRIKEAVESLDTRQIAEVAQQIGEFDPHLRDTVLRMVERFDHPAILDALASVEAPLK
jgi:CheY-like chemotaxis protein